MKDSCKVCGKYVLIDRFSTFYYGHTSNYNDIYIPKNNKTTKF
jgi:hypothetical protein